MDAITSIASVQQETAQYSLPPNIVTSSTEYTLDDVTCDG